MVDTDLTNKKDNNFGFREKSDRDQLIVMGDVSGFADYKFFNNCSKI